MPCPRALPRLLAQHLWGIAIIIIAAICMLVPMTMTSEETELDDTDLAFDLDADPVWFSHISDTHISNIFPEHAKRLQSVLTCLQYHVHPSLTIISGDLSDQLSSDTLVAKAAPMLDQWILYRGVLDMHDLHYLELLGNHDTWGLATDTSPRAYCFQYPHRLTGPGHYCHTTVQDGIRIVVFEPFNFPNPGPTLGYWIVLTHDMLDELEDSLYSETDANLTLLVAHHTSDTFWPQALTSKNGRSFRDMMEKVDGFLNGHLHPKETARVDPFGKTMEYTALAIRTHEAFQIIAFDNHVISYHVLDPNKQNLAVVTFPVPHKQLRVIGSQTEIAVRILAFTGTELEFRVSGAATGTASDRRQVGENVWLYSMPMTLTKGIHNIRISGAIEKEIEFAIGTKTDSFRYTQTRDLNGWSVILVTVLSAVFYAMAFTSMFLRGKWAKPFRDAHNWHKGKIDEPQWLVTLLLGPLVIGSLSRSIDPSRLSFVLLPLIPCSFSQIWHFRVRDMRLDF
jgi:predicted MPP superfamily phosphohydrolase